ncbi:MAG: hypothetical protein R3Y67_08005 [Eubacteriales bacterium]
MNFLIFASSVIFAIFLTIRMISINHQEQKERDAFWSREYRANQTRKKSLDSLTYITIPTDLLEASNPTRSPEIATCLEELSTLSTKVIVNLAGLTNTDLKLKYGAPNLPLLTDYDLCYTRLSRLLNQLGILYKEANELDTAIAFLSFSVETGSDIRTTYHALASIYHSQGNRMALNDLYRRSCYLSKLSKSLIGQTLQEFGPYNDLLDS